MAMVAGASSVSRKQVLISSFLGPLPTAFLYSFAVAMAVRINIPLAAFLFPLLLQLSFGGLGKYLNN